MTDSTPTAVREAFSQHDAFVETTDGFVLETTAFEGTVSLADGAPTASAEGAHRYVVTVAVPTLSAATADRISDVIATDWFETFQRRLADAPTATRAALELAALRVEREDSTVAVTFEFDWSDPAGAAAIAKTLVEYVEGTYVEGIVPGYDYEPPVSDLIASASQSGDSGTPL
jgi:hypothetical protein